MIIIRFKMQEMRGHDSIMIDIITFFRIVLIFFIHVSRGFYFRRLLPGAQRGRAGRRAACSYALLRNSFLENGAPSHRPLALSSVRRLRRPPSNVVVRRQDAAGLSARSAPPGAPAMHLRRPSLHLPRPKYELLWQEGAGARPGLSLGAPRRTLCERPALRRERQRRARGLGALQQADSITSLSSSKNSLPVPSAGLTARTSPAPGPHQARTRPAPARTRSAPGAHQARAAAPQSAPGCSCQSFAEQAGGG